MGAQGIATVNFGAAPQQAGIEARASVTGQAGVLSTSLCEAWVHPPGGTANHSEDEHIVEEFVVKTAAVVAGVGFDIVVRPLRGTAWGIWQVAWVWN